MKFRKIIKFIKKYRELGVASFSIVTTSSELVITAEYQGVREQLRIQYK